MGRMDQMGLMGLMGFGPRMDLCCQNKASRQARIHNRRTLKLDRPDWL